MNRQFQLQLSSRIDALESQKNQFQQLSTRKLSSIEDLFETQRKELFGRMSELDKSMTNKYTSVARAVTEIGKETKVDTTHLLAAV